MTRERHGTGADQAATPESGAELPARSRPGGRSARVRRAVLEATLALLREQGDTFSIPQVAARAGVHDATIYRRWGSRDALVVDAVRSHLGETVPVPDTGSLRGDLTAFLERSVAFLASPLGAQLVRATVGAESPAAGNPRAAYWPARLEQIGVMVKRAVARGELPPTRLAETTLAAEMLLGPLYFRLLVSRDPLDHELVRWMADFVCRALAAKEGEPQLGAPRVEDAPHPEEDVDGATRRPA